MKVLLIENQIHGNGTSIVMVHKILSGFEENKFLNWLSFQKVDPGMCDELNPES